MGALRAKQAEKGLKGFGKGERSFFPKQQREAAAAFFAPGEGCSREAICREEKKKPREIEKKREERRKREE